MSDTSDRTHRQNRAFLFSPKIIAFHLALVAIGLFLRTTDLKIMAYSFLGGALGCAFSILSSKEKVTGLKPFIPSVVIITVGSTAITVIVELLGARF